MLENKRQPEYANAIDYYKQALGIEPGNAYVLMCLGNNTKGPAPDYETSLKHLEQSIAIDPGTRKH